MQVSVSYRLSPYKYTNYPSMCLKLDHWSCNPLAFDREINVLLCKDASPREMAGHSGCHLKSINDQEVPISLIKSRCPTF